MKRFFILLAAITTSSVMFAQTFVDTVASNKNVILEEFTGINCGYCPDAHRIAAELAANNPGRVFPIAIHAGGYAAAYTTTDGNTIFSNWSSQISGYPCGMVNRHSFSGSTILNRGVFASNSNTIMSQASYVNVAAKCTVDFATRQMTITVEAYYTDSTRTASSAPNYLNVVLLQNNVLGSQSGSSLNPSQVIDGQYNHMHMFRDCITPVWGDTITNTAHRACFTKTYNYTAPASISSTAVELENLNIVVFVAEGKSEIITGCEAEMTYLNGQAKLKSLSELEEYTNDCSITYSLATKIANLGLDTIHSIDIEYGTLSLGRTTYTRTGLNILPSAYDTIHLPALTNRFFSNTTYTGVAKITAVNGTPLTSDSVTTSLVRTVRNFQGDTITFDLFTDRYGSETTYDLRKIDGTIVAQGGPFSELSSNTTEEHVIKFVIPGDGCYYLTVYDSYGDGMNTNYGNGRFTISDNNGNSISNNGVFTDKVRYFLKCSGTHYGIETANDVNFNIYPNPTNDFIVIDSEDDIFQIDIIDMMGKVVASNNNCTTISLSNLSKGTYLVRVTTDNGSSVRKVVKE